MQCESSYSIFMGRKFSLVETSTLLDRSYRALLGDIKAGTLNAVKDGNKWFVEEDEIRSFKHGHLGGGMTDAEILSTAGGEFYPPELFHFLIQTWVSHFWEYTRGIDDEFLDQLTGWFRAYNKTAEWLRRNPYHHVGSDRVGLLIEDIPEIVLYQIIARLQEAVMEVGEGHTLKYFDPDTGELDFSRTPPGENARAYQARRPKLALAAARDFRRKYGDLPEFGEVIKAIDKLANPPSHKPVAKAKGEG